MMILYLLRHGIAVDRDAADSVTDADRPLTPKGERRMQREATAMQALGLNFDEIFTSPLIRAKRTAGIVAEAYEAKGRVITTEALAPGLGFGARLDQQSPIVVLLRQRDLESALLVGHEPDLSHLASLLLTGNLNLKLQLKKGGLCAIDVQDLTTCTENKLLWLLAPKQLRAISR
jgi:phosphohistidine phosphatase